MTAAAISQSSNDLLDIELVECRPGAPRGRLCPLSCEPCARFVTSDYESRDRYTGDMPGRLASDSTRTGRKR